MMTKQEGQISKLDESVVKTNEAVAKSNEMMQNMMLAIGANSQQVKVKELTGRVDDIGEKADRNREKTDRIIAALEKAGMVLPPAAPAPATAPAAASAQNAWVTATSGGGRGGSKKRPGRGMGGTVSEDYGGLDDDGDDEHTVPSPSIAERTRSSIARRT